MSKMSLLIIYKRWEQDNRGWGLGDKDILDVGGGGGGNSETLPYPHWPWQIDLLPKKKGKL